MKKIGKESIEWANTLTNIGVVYDEKDKAKKEPKYHLRAESIYEKI
jgi:hypothetical protein